MYTNIGEFICQKRMENNLTLRELASMLSISLTYLADIEHDRRNPMDKAKLDELADILGLTDFTGVKTTPFRRSGKRKSG